MPITSLPSPYGVGTMGAAARDFVEFLSAAGQKYWQVLPMGPTSYGDSPYQAFSTFAGNPYLIDLDDLAAQGLLERGEYDWIHWGDDPASVDYGRLHEGRFGVLQCAVDRLVARNDEGFAAFKEAEKAWLEDYALFMACKNAANGAAWWQWESGLVRREPAAMAKAKKELASEVEFWSGVQYLFFTQWEYLREVAAEKGVEFIGDVPIYVARDSADVWSAPGEFLLDEDLNPVEVAGCPPDAFSATGQLWGNPLFDWKAMEKGGFAWWIARVEHQFRLYDVVRIDHFRGFDSFYAIPAADKDAKNGTWRKGPGMKLFRAIERKLGKRRIIAEDLGFLTPSVKKLLADSGFPGMKILEFAFDRRGGSPEYQPHNYGTNCVAYVGTHDNPTALGWLAETHPDDSDLAWDYLGLNEHEGEAWGLMRGIWSSRADLAVVQMQDLLGLGTEARVNTPGTSEGNWCWRMLPGSATPELAARVARSMKTFDRVPAAEAEKAADQAA